MGSITRLISDVRQGSDQAASELWIHYWDRLCAVARRELVGLPTQMVDDEDVAITAFHSFVRRLRAGEYPKLQNRDEGWRLLVVIAVRKALNCLRDSKRQRRNPSVKIASLSQEQLAQAAIDEHGQAELNGQITESVEHLLALLDSDEMRDVAMAKLAGYSNAEIAVSLNRSEATVERRLKLIRLRWKEELKHG